MDRLRYRRIATGPRRGGDREAQKACLFIRHCVGCPSPSSALCEVRSGQKVWDCTVEGATADPNFQPLPAL